MNIFILTMEKNNMCNVKDVSHRGEATEDQNSPNSAVSCSSTERYSVFQLIVLFLQPIALLF